MFVVLSQQNKTNIFIDTKHIKTKTLARCFQNREQSNKNKNREPAPVLLIALA